MPIEFGRVVPVLRTFSVEKARAFHLGFLGYLGFLGFKVDWEHRFDDGAPVSMQVSREGIALPPSEHHGDGTSGTVTYVRERGVEALDRELVSRNDHHNRPGLAQQPWGMLEVMVVDPFNNRIVFGENRSHEQHAFAAPPR